MMMMEAPAKSPPLQTNGRNLLLLLQCVQLVLLFPSLHFQTGRPLRHRRSRPLTCPNIHPPMDGLLHTCPNIQSYYYTKAAVRAGHPGNSFVGRWAFHSSGPVLSHGSLRGKRAVAAASYSMPSI